MSVPVGYQEAVDWQVDGFQAEWDWLKKEAR